MSAVNAGILFAVIRKFFLKFPMLSQSVGRKLLNRKVYKSEGILHFFSVIVKEKNEASVSILPDKACDISKKGVHLF